MTIKFAIRCVDNMVVISMSHATYKKDVLSILKDTDGIYDLECPLEKHWHRDGYEFLSTLQQEKTIVFFRNPTLSMNVIIGRIENRSEKFERVIWCG